MAIIIDTSVIYKWIAEEEPKEEMEKAYQLMDRHIQGEEVCISMDLIFYELGNILSMRKDLSMSEIMTAWNRFLDFKIQIVSTTEKNITAAVKLAKVHGITVYDASYVVLAQDKNCNFITADRKLVSKVNLPFVKHILTVE